MNNLQQTMKFRFDIEKDETPQDVLNKVLEALKEKGYNPMNQIVGYLISDDPTYITSYKNARSHIQKFDRDELLEELVRFYIENNNK